MEAIVKTLPEAGRSGPVRRLSGFCIHELFERQVAATPSAPAVEQGGLTLSYRDLNECANRLARYLRHLGVRPEERVAICMPHCFELLVAMLAVAKAGAAYVPLDPSHPRERHDRMMADCDARLLLTLEQLRGQEPQRTGRLVLSLDGAQRLWEQQASGDSPKAALGLTSHHLAYVIYTSGSTGEPKGVMVEHRSLVNFIRWLAETFRLCSGERMSCTAGVAFDAFGGEVWLGLITGATLVLPPAEVSGDPMKLLDWWSAQELDFGFLVTPLAEATFSRNHPGKRFRSLLTGGDRLSRLPPSHLPFEVVNVYGPTEITIAATAGRVHPDDEVIHVGRPIANTKVYLLDAHGQPVAAGQAGEIYIGGAGVARGYLNQPELTRERFLDDPFSSEHGARMYKTGDLGRWRPDGTIEFLGRNDHQVKIRGFRIELGEIESQLLHIPGVREAVVLVREDTPGEKRLVAYVTGNTLPDAEALRSRLSEKVPHYMVPSAYVVLDRMPLTSNGKFDRKALPAPEDTAFGQRVYEAPRGEMEIALAQIWSELLRVGRVGRNDHFFKLGGHSLLAAQMSSRLRQRLNREVEASSLFAHPVLSDFAARVAQAPTSTLPVLVPAKRPEVLPLSFAQRSLWFIARMGEDARAAYHLAIGLRMRGALNEAALQAALDRIVQRHEALRTHFEVVDGQPVQRIAETGTFTLLRHDLASGHADIAAAVEHWRRVEATAPFDLTSGPLIRGRLLRIGDQEHVLLLTAHHIVADGWSLSVLMRELSQVYGAFCRGEPDPLAPLMIQYADYALWQRQVLNGPVLHEPLQHWVQQLSDAPQLIALPTDRPRPAIQDYRGATLNVSLERELVEALRALSQRHGTTLYVTVLAAWAAVLSRLSAQEQVVIGSSQAGRNCVELESLIGFFVNTQALKVDLGGSPSVQALLAQASRLAVQAQSLHDVPFEKIVEALNPRRSLAHHPVFQVMLSWNNTPEVPVDLAGVSAERLPYLYFRAPFDLALDIEETNGGICGQLSYATALFDEPTIVRHWGYLRAMLRGMVADERQPVEHIELLDAAERTLVLESFNATRREYPKRALLHELFEQQVEQDPDRIAVELAGEQVSYGRLNSQANQLAHHLRQLGVRPDDRVAICVERSPQMVVAMLAVLKAGGAYVPLDPAYPDERLAHMLGDSGPVALLTQSHLGERLQVPRSCVRVVLDDNAWQHSAWSACPTTNPSAGEIGLKATHLAYVIYTSGSSGLPKGVMVEHRQVSAQMAALKEIYAIGPEDRVLQFSALTFDVSVEEIFGTLLCGATLVLRTDEWITDPQQWCRLCASHALTIANLPTLFWQRLAQEPHAVIPAQLRLIIIGSEAVSASALESWWRRYGHRPALTNAYGPTETTINATIARCTAETSALSIGHPVPNSRIYILDAHRRPVPVGVAGEIYIAGAQVARGYLNQPELTTQRFVENPFSGEAGGRMYRTGDLGRWGSDGAIEYLGRNDFQVKIRGFRIELGEIEAQLSRVAGVREAVVIAREDTAGEKRLVAYVVADAEVSPAPNPALLRGALSERLPEYMLPAAYVLLETLPLTPNGKVDRKALPAPEDEAFIQQTYEAPIGEVEQTLAQIWSGLLGVERVGRHDSFFDLGGHSLLLTRLVEDARRRGLVMDLRQVFEASTLAGLAAIVKPGHHCVMTQGRLVPIRAAGSQRPLFCPHDGFGGVLVYERLARFIDAEVPVYSLEARALHEDSPIYRPLADMARDYLRQITAVQPVGPYRLAGWSSGGMLAYEIAHQLLAQGETVGFLGMIDTYKLTLEHLAGEGTEAKHYLIQLLEYTHPNLPAEAFSALLAFDDLDTMVGECHRRGWLKAEVTSREMQRRFQVANDITRACLEYSPPALALEVDLFSAQEPARLDRSNGWARILGPHLKITPVGGNHVSMIQDEALIAQVAGPMNDALLSAPAFVGGRAP